MLDVSARTARLGLIAGAAAAVLGLSSPAALAAPTPGALKTVTYLGYEFAVPASWPVIDTTRASTSCVRFDRHAIYLGDPGQNQDCPRGLIGTTEAILVQPAPGPVSAASAAEDQASRRITVLSPGIEVTATYDTDPAAAAAALPASATSYTGQGFDACTAPSSAFMSTWKSASPYGAVGIYIGG